MSAVIAPFGEGRTIMQVARGIGAREPLARTVPLTLGRREPTAHLLVAYFLEMDPEGTYPAVMKSHYGLYLDADETRMLAHWDYERDPEHSYPAAHVQVNAGSTDFHELCERASAAGLDCPRRDLKDAHLPVGGRRFRPSLEDVVEFLIVERLAQPRRRWEEVIEAHRAEWEERQLRAAVRRDPPAAMDQLEEDGYIVR